MTAREKLDKLYELMNDNLRTIEDRQKTLQSRINMKWFDDYTTELASTILQKVKETRKYEEDVKELKKKVYALA